MSAPNEERAALVALWRHISTFAALSGAASFAAVLIDRPAAILLSWLGGFLAGLITEFRGRSR